MNFWIQLRLLCSELLAVMASPQESVQTSWRSEVKWGSVYDARCRTSWIENTGFVNWMFTKSHKSRDVNFFAALKAICFYWSWYRSIDIVNCIYRSINFGPLCKHRTILAHTGIFLTLWHKRCSAEPMKSFCRSYFNFASSSPWICFIGLQAIVFFLLARIFFSFPEQSLFITVWKLSLLCASHYVDAVRTCK